jgi:fatty acyl-CoA reductase
VFFFSPFCVVISSTKEPIPGWINNVYGPTGVVAAAAVGLLHVLQVDQNCKANIVPCDYAVNAAIASAWSVGTKYVRVASLENLCDDPRISFFNRSIFTGHRS